MGTRLATFRFPDDTVLYGTHHTTSYATGGPLYRGHAHDGYREDVDLLAEWHETDLCRTCVRIAVTRHGGWWS